MFLDTAPQGFHFPCGAGVIHHLLIKGVYPQKKVFSYY